MSSADLKKLRNKQRRQERKKAAAEEKKKAEQEKAGKRRWAFVDLFLRWNSSEVTAFL